MTPSDAHERLWTDGAKAWEEAFDPQRTPLFDGILDACGVGPGMDVLDAGCGSGGIAALAGTRGAHAAGFDISEGMVGLARAKVPDGDFRVGGLDAVPFESDGFDAVIACDCLPFADDTVRAIEELGRVCRADGTVAVAIWEVAENSDYSRIFAAMEASLPKPTSITPLRLSADGLLDRLVRRAGLSVRETRDLPLEYRFANFDEYWRAARMLGGIGNMIRLAGEDRVRDAAHEAAAPCIRSSGELVMQNAYRLLKLSPNAAATR
jgi:SAM-dependent methyltransferase